jgi:hypothetical protein
VFIISTGEHTTSTTNRAHLAADDHAAALPAADAALVPCANDGVSALDEAQLLDDRLRHVRWRGRVGGRQTQARGVLDGLPHGQHAQQHCAPGMAAAAAVRGRWREERGRG